MSAPPPSELEVTERTAFGPLWPAFVGVATRLD